MYVYRCNQCGDITPTIVLRDTASVPLCRHSGGDFPMELLPDTSKALLPMDQDPTDWGGFNAHIVPMKVAPLHRAGILLPETQHALEWLYRHRATNGMAGAFLSVGGRRCIDLVAFAKLMREKKA